MIRTPNKEQEIAIKHTGGVLLSAGAGSGKTFVLVEHVIHLIQLFNQEIGLEVSEIDYKQRLKKYLSTILMMTFTKKAAGEMSLRVRERIDTEYSLTNDFRWKLASEAIYALTISTIDGVCHKILSSGVVPYFGTNIEISSSLELNQKISDLFKSWYESLADSEKSRPITKIYLSQKRSIVSSLVSIFSDASTRYQWRNQDLNSLELMNYKDFFANCLKLQELDDIFKIKVSRDDFPAKKEKWMDTLDKMESLLERELDSLENYYKYLEDLQGLGRITKPRKAKGLVQVEDFFDKVKALKDFLQKSQETIDHYEENKNGIYKDWLYCFKNIVDYVEVNYRKVDGFNFADLEYYLLRALEDDKIASKVQERYSYVIVDEFQDTSYIQFDIIKKIINNDLGKLFCVGDRKQAIYGFRGGELGVFEKCEHEINSSYSMTNNYRSKPNIINLNNKLFESIFKKGFGFTGTDPFQVAVEYQSSPLDKYDYEGFINKKSITVNSDQSLNRTHYDYVEAISIYNSIIEQIDLNPDNTQAVLYSRLAPSKFLIAKLIENNISFTAQIKIPCESDPVIILFKTVVDLLIVSRYKTSEEYIPYATKLLGTVLSFLDANIPSNLETSLYKLKDNFSYMGIGDTFKSFIFSIGIFNSNFTNNLDLIDSILKNSNEDLELISDQIEESGGDRYSLDFEVGEDGKKLQLMTVHASKGLEFDFVYLAGIHTNSISSVELGSFGKSPGSFKWKPSSNMRSPVKSFEYIIEELIAKKKDFAESKRLFYVACTRAVIGITWFDLEKDGKAFSHGGQSWIDGIRSWERDDISIELAELIANKGTHFEINFDELCADYSNAKLQTPLFHRDNVGIQLLQDDSLNLGLSAELSVTRLATIVDCPFKFYLKNICKFDSEDMEYLSDKSLLNPKEILESKLLDDEIESISSAERGTDIHYQISRRLKDNSFSSKSDPVEYAVEEIKKEEFKELISESAIKFKLFGQMINGIPDLVIKGDQVQIWDFKSGHRDLSVEQSYQFQLCAYAAGLYDLGICSRDESINLVILYVDDRVRTEMSYTYDDVINYLYPYWTKLGNLSVKEEACSHCEFVTICK